MLAGEIVGWKIKR